MLEPDLRGVEAEYAERDPFSTSYPWHPLSSLSTTYRHRLERALVPVLRSLGDLGQLDVLDVGCGVGQHLRWLVEQGAASERVHGIDAVQSRIDLSRTMNSALDVRLGRAETLPFDDESFDLITQFTAFSSMERSLRAAAADEIRRVARAGATLIWYDVKRPAPVVPDGIPLAEVRSLFHGFEVMRVESMCSRVLPRVSRWALASALVECVPLFRTNLFAVLRAQAPARA